MLRCILTGCPVNLQLRSWLSRCHRAKLELPPKICCESALQREGNRGQGEKRPHHVLRPTSFRGPVLSRHAPGASEIHEIGCLLALNDDFTEPSATSSARMWQSAPVAYTRLSFGEQAMEDTPLQYSTSKSKNCVCKTCANAVPQQAAIEHRLTQAF